MCSKSKTAGIFIRNWSSCYHRLLSSIYLWILNYENLLSSIFNKIKKQMFFWRCVIYQRKFLCIFGALNQEVHRRRRSLPPFCVEDLKQIFTMANVCCQDHSERRCLFLYFHDEKTEVFSHTHRYSHPSLLLHHYILQMFQPPDSTFCAHNSTSALQHQQKNSKVVLNHTKSNFG